MVALVVLSRLRLSYATRASLAGAIAGGGLAGGIAVRGLHRGRHDLPELRDGQPVDRAPLQRVRPELRLFGPEWYSIWDRTIGSHAPWTGDLQVATAYDACAFTVYPSEIEGFGLPVVEAMACGLPVVATAVSVIPDLLRGGGGRLVDRPDAVQIRHHKTGVKGWLRKKS